MRTLKEEITAQYNYELSEFISKELLLSAKPVNIQFIGLLVGVFVSFSTHSFLAFLFIYIVSAVAHKTILDIQLSNSTEKFHQKNGTVEEWIDYAVAYEKGVKTITTQLSGQTIWCIKHMVTDWHFERNPDHSII